MKKKTETRLIIGIVVKYILICCVLIVICIKLSSGFQLGKNQMDSMFDELKQLKKENSTLSIGLAQRLAHFESDVREIRNAITDLGKQMSAVYENKECSSQISCGGMNSGYYCDYTEGRCVKTEFKTCNQIVNMNNPPYYCKSTGKDNNTIGTVKSFYSAKAWCESIGKEPLDPNFVVDHCDAILKYVEGEAVIIARDYKYISCYHKQFPVSDYSSVPTRYYNERSGNIPVVPICY